jgi:starch phosphorylase
MKFALNGALTVGTLDGANIEIMEEVGRENIFIFGLTAEEVISLRSGYRPLDYYHANPALKQAIDLIREGFFSPDQPSLFQPLVDLLLYEDRYMVLADFDAYHQAQMGVDALYCDTEEWTKKSILNVARIAKFSSDRTILEYNQDIWRAAPVPIERNHVGSKKLDAATANGDTPPVCRARN